MGDNNTPEEHQPSRRTRARAAVVPLLGIVAVLVGGLIAWTKSHEISFGWFAYAPLSNQPFSGTGLVFLSPGTQTGLAIAVAGLLVLAFWAGLSIGRRSNKRTQ
ncbi:hypothetical protein FDW83_12065 [Pseudarthrobacter sp. NamE2]|uniref:hypothetical protein n=1 Tax=Pseudarthrobacter sp. NamE2 TaxID=2576838 RepID=UPI0010FEAD96|nr:hypothetical protein [Pseudarthrobacter sp. NamE2]TLM82682.1 hypothetical protein FDW83_12065 [Pseudarthrobacter sp. NamE2]